MKIPLSVVLVSVAMLSGCASPQPQPANQPAAAQQPSAATPDQAQTALATDQTAPKKKKCVDPNTTGSRLGGCTGSGDYVQGENGASFRQQMGTTSNAMTGIPHN